MDFTILSQLLAVKHWYSFLLMSMKFHLLKLVIRQKLLTNYSGSATIDSTSSLCI
jgi:hypothetical protein